MTDLYNMGCEENSCCRKASENSIFNVNRHITFLSPLSERKKKENAVKDERLPGKEAKYSVSKVLRLWQSKGPTYKWQFGILTLFVWRIFIFFHPKLPNGGSKINKWCVLSREGGVLFFDFVSCLIQVGLRRTLFVIQLRSIRTSGSRENTFSIDCLAIHCRTAHLTDVKRSIT